MEYSKLPVFLIKLRSMLEVLFQSKFIGLMQLKHY